MDIRKFFGKADGKKSGAKKKSGASAATARPKTAPADKQKEEVESKKRSPGEMPQGKQDHVEVSKEDFFAQADSNGKKPAAKKSKRDHDIVEVSEEGSPSPAKKAKPQVVLEKEMAEDDTKSKPLEKENACSLWPTAKKESPAESTAKKRRLVIDDDDDEDDDVIPMNSVSKGNKKKIEDDDDDSIDEETEDQKPPKPIKKTPKKSPKKAKTTPPSKRKSKKEEHKEWLIQPGLKLKPFSSGDVASLCLSGTTFVFTGILETKSREECEELVKILGGRVTTAVSGKTDYLVAGEVLEDGRPYTEGSKYRKAKENDVIVLKGEEDFYGLVKLYSDRTGPEKPPSASSATAAAPAPSAKMPANPYAKRPANPYPKSANTKSAGAANPYASNPYASKGPSPTKQEAAPAKTFDPMSLWADRFAPQSTREILGNQENVKKLANWLNRWESTFNNSKAQGKTFSSPNGPWKAALISGPPGIGKTTSATLVAKESGRDLLEFNASDARSKKAISQGMGDVTGSQVLNFNPKKDGKKPASKKRIIIMDEVDGMGAGDRSGMAELIKMIKGSMVPIICICNDRQSQKVKSLLPYCMDLRYRRPTKSVIARRAVQIGQQQGMRIETNAAEAIAESCGNDIRQVLNCLQMWSNKKGDSMTYKDLKERENDINKDEILRVSMFDATKIIVQGRRGLSGVDPKAERDSLYNRSDAFFVDYGLMGLMVHQNYPKVLAGQYSEARRANSEDKTLEFLEQMHAATDAMSDFAVAENAVRSGDQNWGLLPFAAMMCVKTGYHAGGENGGFLSSFPEFAGWMGKNSTRGKKTRLLNELSHHMNYKVSGDTQELRMSYLPILRERFSTLLTADDGAKTEEAIQLMDEYGLDRDDLFENLDEFKMDKNARALSSLLDSKQKAAFTRAYNAVSHKSQALVDEQGAGKTKRSKSSSNGDLKDPEVVDDDAQLESGDDEDDDDDDAEGRKALENFKKKSKKKGGRKSTGKNVPSKGKSKANK